MIYNNSRRTSTPKSSEPEALTVNSALTPFNGIIKTAQLALEAARTELENAQGTDVAALTAYQAALAEYTTSRSAQTNSIKAIKDIDASIIQNLR